MLLLFFIHFLACFLSFSVSHIETIPSSEIIANNFLKGFLPSTLEMIKMKQTRRNAASRLLAKLKNVDRCKSHIKFLRF